MWLLHTSTLQLESVNSSEDRTYAILSHTWEEGEVSLQDMANLDLAKSKKGFSKIERTCQLACDRGISYAWVDTCCIDKTSSAELTEAINSMFKWYKDSAVCFAFLSDLAPPLESTDDWLDGFRRCRWFMRGWTLQELIAPLVVEFYDRDWTIRGDKASLRGTLLNITGIDIEVLTDSRKMKNVPVARRMSWAAMRETTRVEDLAYCLFGIFDVNLPLIYGEGAKAFIRLQEGIVTETFDLSMFAWTSGHGDQQYRGIFARSPYEFRNCGTLVNIADPNSQTTQFEMTHRGIDFTTPLLNLAGEEKGFYLLNLNCKHSGVMKMDEIHGAIVIPLVRIRNGFVRYYSRTLASVPLLQLMTHEYKTSRHFNKTAVHVYVPKVVDRAASDLIAIRRAHQFSFRIKNSTRWQIHTKNFYPEHLWYSTSNSFATEGQGAFTAAIEIYLKGKTYTAEWNPTTQKDDLDYLETSWPGFHISLGLLNNSKQDQEENDDLDTQIEPLEPWAAIYRNNAFRAADWGLITRNRRPSSQFRIQSEKLPSTLTLTHPYIQESRSYTTEVRRHSKEHSLVLSLTTNVLPERESGMYELVLSIREEGVTSGPIRFGADKSSLSEVAIPQSQAQTQSINIPRPRPRPDQPPKRQSFKRHGLLSIFGL